MTDGIFVHEDGRPMDATAIRSLLAWARLAALPSVEATDVEQAKAQLKEVFPDGRVFWSYAAFAAKAAKAKRLLTESCSQDDADADSDAD